MKYKTLKHRHIPEKFGIILHYHETDNRKADAEIYHSDIPELLYETATMDKLKEKYEQMYAYNELDDYGWGIYAAP